MPAAYALPVPSPEHARVVVPAPGEGRGFWAGGPSAVRADDGVYWLAYRLRRPLGEGRGYANVVARSEDGEHFETVAVLTRDVFNCDSLERPVLTALPDGSWRLYVSCATPGTYHWRVDALDAADPSSFNPSSARTILPGDPATMAVKDPVIKLLDGQWHMWLCCHPLDRPDDTDRMSTHYGTSADGLEWTMHGVALEGRAGQWDQRGTRVAEVRRIGGRWHAYYDGRASKEENAEERTGLAVGRAPGKLEAEGGVIGMTPEGEGSLRYVSAVDAGDGGIRLFYETSRRDGAHDLRTEYVPPSR
jgi:hypothetical protein